MTHAVKKKVPDVDSGFLSILFYSVRWILFSGVLLVAFLFYAALYSYSENDPAWTNATGQDVVQNWMGPIGANAAAIGNMLFGNLVYSIPLVLCLCAYQLLIKTSRYRFEIDTLAIKLVVLLVFIAVGCGLFQVATGINSGIVGDVMGNRFLFNLTGLFPFLSIDYLWYFVIVLLTFLFFVSLIILTGTMPLYWIDKVGALWLLLFSWVINLFSKKQDEQIDIRSSLARVSHLMSQEEIRPHAFETETSNLYEKQATFVNEPVFYDTNSFVNETMTSDSDAQSLGVVNQENDQSVDSNFNAQSINAVPDYYEPINNDYMAENIDLQRSTNGVLYRNGMIQNTLQNNNQNNNQNNIQENIQENIQTVSPFLFSETDTAVNNMTQNDRIGKIEPDVNIDSFSQYQRAYFSRLTEPDAQIEASAIDIKESASDNFKNVTNNIDSGDNYSHTEQSSMALPFGKLYQSSFSTHSPLLDSVLLSEKKAEIIPLCSDSELNNASDNLLENKIQQPVNESVHSSTMSSTSSEQEIQEPIHPAWSKVIQQRKSLLAETILTPKFDLVQNNEAVIVENNVSEHPVLLKTAIEKSKVDLPSSAALKESKELIESQVNPILDKPTEMPLENSLVMPLINTTTRKMQGYEVDPRTGAPKPIVSRIFPNQGQLPPLSLLTKEPPKTESYHQDELDYMAGLIEVNLKHFGIAVKVVHIDPGPVITRFELDLAPGIKVAQINNLDKDLARGLSVTSLRVVDIIPGKPYVGLEIPNRKREMVYFRTGMETVAYQQSKHPLTLILGKNTSGEPVITNLAKMPHLLVAGTTGSGKSVGINTMLLSMLFKAKADELRMILIDPKMLELANYNDIPHLLTPVITDMKDAANALRWCVSEMERRYLLMSKLKVKGFDSYNALVKNALLNGGSGIPDPLWVKNDHVSATQMRPILQPFYYIVVVIDEFADMMMQVGKKCEELIARLAQKARASGIHLIVATQRPSADVLTGIIKANIPTRIAFQVSSKIDSRVILEKQGAESLLGNGDMLFMAPGSGEPIRVHGAFVNEKEVNDVADFLRLTGEPEFIDDVTEEPTEVIAGLSIEASGVLASESDPLFDDAVRYVVESKKTSVSALQRRMKIGFNRAANLMEEMEKSGIVSTMSNGAREILIDVEDIM